MANKKNFANGQLNAAINTSVTSIVLNSGQGSNMPAVPFFATITPKNVLSTIGNSEVVLVTARSTDTLTVTRAQKGTTAKSFVADDILANGIYVEDINGVDVTVATAATTATKVGTTAAANYAPTYGDTINVTFTSGSNVASPTLNIDGSGAKNIRLGNVNVTTSFLSTTTSTTLKLWYDGTYWQMFGSLKNDNTTYTEITDVEAADNTNSTGRLITGRRLQTAISAAFTAVTGFVRSATTARLTVSGTAPASPSNGDIWYDTADDTAATLLHQVLGAAYPVGTIYYNGTNNTNPGTLFGFGTWTPYLEGRTPVGKASSGTFGTAGAEVGAETHTLTIAEMPAHTHISTKPAGRDYLWNNSAGGTAFGTGTGRGSFGGFDPSVSYEGGSGAHNNIQPSKVVYAWIRTA